MTLRLLLDEDTERALAPKLTEDGHDVERVATVDALGTGSDDREVCEYALETDRIVVSHDDDFLTHPVDAHAGVFYVPNQRLLTHRIASFVQSVIDAYGSRDRIDPVVFLTENWL